MANGKPHEGRRARPIRRKNLNIDQDKLDRAVDVLEAATETEAVDRALDLVLLRDELLAGVASIAGSGGVEDVYSGDEEP